MMIHYNGKVIEDKNYKRNYLLFVFDTILFTNAMTFLSVNAVIAYFLNTLGASTLEISLVSVLSSVSIFISQPLFAKSRPHFMVILFLICWSIIISIAGILGYNIPCDKAGGIKIFFKIS